MDILVNFKITQNGAVLTMSGHRSMRNPKSPKLSFCQGRCGIDNTFIVAAFHVLKFK